MGDDDHVSLDELAAWDLGTRDGARARAIAEHIASGCARCAADLEWVRRTVRLARAQRLVAPPADVLQRAFAVPRRPEETSGAAALLRLIGRLVFDSAYSPQQVGLRGPADAGRQVLYAVDDLGVEIDMRVEIDSPARRCHLTGQVLPSASKASNTLPSAAIVEAADGTCTTGEVYPTGEIAASYPQDGPCILLLWIGSTQLALPILEP